MLNAFRNYPAASGIGAGALRVSAYSLYVSGTSSNVSVPIVPGTMLLGFYVQSMLWSATTVSCVPVVRVSGNYLVASCGNIGTGDFALIKGVVIEP
jgi:hypothetical protein